MFKYTPNPEILKELKLARKKPYNAKTRSSGQWDLASSYFSDYKLKNVFLKHWEHTCFYSPMRVQFVPVNGFQFERKFFKEEVS